MKLLNLFLKFSFFILHFGIFVNLGITQVECSKLKSSFKHQKSNRLSPIEISETEKYDVTFYKLDIELSDQSNYISGDVDIHLTTISNLDSIIIELHENLIISDIKVNDISNIFHRTNSAIIISKNLSKNEEVKVSISYYGTAPNANENPLGGSGLNNQTESSTNTKVTYSLSEPYSAYEWWPCKQSLTDKADSCYIFLTVPNNCLAGSNGLLVNKTDVNNNKTRFEWQHKYPIDYYLISVAVAQYQEYSYYSELLDGDSLLIQNYLYNDSIFLNYWKPNIDSVGAYINLFSELYGFYPFSNEKYGHCTAPLGGGMEHQTMTTQIHFDKNLTAHELAHQWFGDNVTCSSWKDIWVNEGFATYSQYLMLENMYPDESEDQIIAYQNHSMNYLDGSIYVTDTLNTSRIFDYRLTYAKGAAFIHTLRYLINNDSIFFSSLTEFQEELKGKTASAEDVRFYLEKNSLVNLQPAFDELYYGEGFPTYSVKWNSFGTDLVIEASQSPSGAFLTQVFTQPIELKIELQNGTDTIIKMNLDQSNEKFYFDNFGYINQIKEIDPSNWLINKVDTIYKDTNLNLTGLSNQIIETVEVYPNPTDRICTIVVHNLEENTLQLIDTKGKVLIETDFIKETNIDLSKFSKGEYIINIKTSQQETHIKKIIKL